MEYAAPYLGGRTATPSATRWATAPSSRAARAALPVWAAIRSLGRDGRRGADRAQLRRTPARSPQGLAALPGCEILNDVVLNQVLLRFETDERTAAVLAAVQHEGEAWMGPTVWDGRAAIRISVSCWRTNDDDVRRTVEAFARAVAAL